MPLGVGRVRVNLFPLLCIKYSMDFILWQGYIFMVKIYKISLQLSFLCAILVKGIEKRTQQKRQGKMIKIFIPAIKGRTKTPARGLWYSKESKKIYYDYLNIKDYGNPFNVFYHYNNFIIYLNDIKKRYSQECIFYKINNTGFIFYSKDKIQVLPHRIYKEVLRHDLKKTIRDYLNLYGGLTVYHTKRDYTIEVFTTI